MKTETVKIISLMLAALMLLPLFGCAKKEEALPGDVCIRAGDSSVTKEMYSYFFNSYYRDFVEQHSEYVRGIGLDTEKSLREQEQAEGVTWYDYLSSLVRTQIEENLALVNGAGDEGITLSSDGKKKIGDIFSEYESDADGVRMSLEEYLPWAFGEGVDKKCVEKCLEIKTLAEEYKAYVTSHGDVSDEDYSKYYEEAPKALLRYDYIKITVSKDKVERFMTCYDRETFTTAVRDTITEQNFHGNYADFKDMIERQVDDKIHIGESYTPGSDVSEWAFEEGRRAFDIHTKEQSTGNVTVTMIFSAKDREGAYTEVLYRDGETLKNIKYIRFTDKNEGAGVFGKYSEGIDEKTFEELSSRYGSEELSDLERTACPAILVPWVFSSERKPGDVGFVEAPDGEGFIVYYGEEGGPAWKKSVQELAAKDGYNEKVASVKEKYPCSFDDEKIGSVKEVSFGN